MRSQAQISPDVLCRYAADAARDVPGVRALVESHLPVRHRGVRLTSDDEGTRVELHVAVEWGTSIPALGRAVQQRVQDYLAQMADVDVGSVDVVVAQIVRPGA